jgi:hypothetical protein
MVIVTSCVSGTYAAPDREPTLERGIRLVEKGEWSAALPPLLDAVRRLAGDKARAAEAAEACLYSGLAYVGLGETSPAISQFALALKLDPKIQIPAPHQAQAAKDAFEVARVESVSPQEPKAKGKSPLPYILGGAALVGGGVAVAAGGGGAAREGPSLPTSFTLTGTTGTPPLTLVSAIPGSSSTIRQNFPTLIFALRFDAVLPARVRATAELLGPSGSCITGRTSEVTTVDPSLAGATLEVNSWLTTCQGGFTTTSMNVRLIDADAGVTVSLTSYAGGYNFSP